MSRGVLPRVGAALAALAMAVAVGAACPPPAAAGSVAAASTHPRGGERGGLTLVDQAFDIAATGAITVDIDLPDNTTLADLADTTLTVAVYPPVESREQVNDALNGELARQIDSVSAPTVLLGPSPAADLRVVVPTEIDTRSAAALQLPGSGIYPLRISILRGAEELLTLTSFVHRLPADDEPSERPLEVAIVLAAIEPVTMNGGADVLITDSGLAELDRLATVLAASPAPVAVRLTPALLEAMAADEQHAELLTRLRAALAGDDLISAPLLPLDASAAAAAERQPLYTQWLRQGEDALADVAAAPPTRTLTVIDQPLSTAGGALVRDLGARLFVITPTTYAEFGGPDASGLDGRLIDMGISATSSVPATVIDAELASVLESGSAQPTLTAITIAAHLLAERQSLADQGIDPSRRGVTLSTTDLSAPDARVFSAVTRLLANTSGLDAVHLDTLGLRAETATDTDGQPFSIRLPDTVPASIASRVTAMTTLTAQAADTGSMLSTESQRPKRWQELIAVLPTAALTDDQVAAITGDLFAEFAAIRGAVELPTGSSFNLTGRQSTVRVKIGNNGTEPLMVLVRLTSPKLLTPDGDQTVTLLPGQFTEVPIQIEARSNGRTPVTLQVFTPNGGTRLGPPVPMQAKITALNGLGNLVSGALALVLITWWVRHVRKNRRARAAGETAGRHPVNSPRADEPRGPALSPDAEASTLPDL